MKLDTADVLQKDQLSNGTPVVLVSVYGEPSVAWIESFTGKVLHVKDDSESIVFTFPNKPQQTISFGKFGFTKETAGDVQFALLSPETSRKYFEDAKNDSQLNTPLKQLVNVETLPVPPVDPQTVSPQAHRANLRRSF